MPRARKQEHERVRVYRQNRVGVVLKPHVRFAMALELESYVGDKLFCGGIEIRDLAMEAMKARGWTDEKMREAWNRFDEDCQRKGKENPFPAGAWT